MENIFFLALIAVVALLRWAMQAAETKRNAEAQRRSDPPPPDMPIMRAPAQSEEERMRKFFEALGVPGTSPPPPKVQRRTVPPKTAAPRRPKILPVDPFPIPRAGPAVPPFVARVPDEFSPTPEPSSEARPLPTRETTVLPEPSLRSASPARRAVATFDVRDLDEVLLDDSIAREPGKKTTGAAPRLAARLATSEGLRDAMVLREIFGPPRSMVSLV